MYQIKQNLSPNFKQGRNGRSIIAIVDHITGGSFPGCLSWMCNPEAKASAQYLVTSAGEIYQLVREEDTAYHAGIVQRPSWSLYDGTNPNRYTIGIEHENLGGGALTEAQYQATLWLHRQLVQKYGISVDADHIIGHYRIDSVNRPNCPGPEFPWARLFSDLKGESGMPTVTIRVGSLALQGVLIGQSSYAPVKALCHALGREVQWDGSTNTVVVLPFGGALQFTPEPKIAVNGQLIPAVLIGQSSYAPVKALAEALGRTVVWDGPNNTVIIK